ncbi:uncharacterized protein BKA78DRAFT_176550 [Phyllosticta capitalensis]|uniref:uncharacterized protein n=1 Tax=Phyllosticta capitalensis TaxID=121624 RepID=UPI00312E9652
MHLVAFRPQVKPKLVSNNPPGRAGVVDVFRSHEFSILTPFHYWVLFSARSADSVTLYFPSAAGLIRLCMFSSCSTVGQHSVNWAGSVLCPMRQAKGRAWTAAIGRSPCISPPCYGPGPPELARPGSKTKPEDCFTRSIPLPKSRGIGSLAYNMYVHPCVHGCKQYDRQ